MWSKPASASSEAIRSSSDSPMPTRIPLVNGIRSSPAARMVASRYVRVLGRRALVGDEVGVDRLEHQALGGGHLAQPGEVVARQHAEVGVRQQAALERPLARPHDVAREVLEARARASRSLHAGVVVGRLAGEHQQLLGAVALRAVEDPLDLVRLVQVRPVRRERAVLAVAAARPRQRQRQVAREGDAAAIARHHTRRAIPAPRAPRGAHAGRLRRLLGRRPAERGRDAAARLLAQRRALRASTSPTRAATTTRRACG